MITKSNHSYNLPMSEGDKFFACNFGCLSFFYLRISTIYDIYLLILYIPYGT